MQCHDDVTVDVMVIESCSSMPYCHNIGSLHFKIKALLFFFFFKFKLCQMISTAQKNPCIFLVLHHNDLRSTCSICPQLYESARMCISMVVDSADWCRDNDEP